MGREVRSLSQFLQKEGDLILQKEGDLKTDLLHRLNRGEIVVCDGAMGTMLQFLGYNPGESPERWGVEHEEVLRKIHRGYIQAGVDIILTNTFGGSRIKLKRYGLDSEVKLINRRLAEIAVDEASRASKSVYVAGDVGPTSEFMEPLGLLTESDMVEVFSQQIKALVEGGVDLIFIETMMDLNEAAAAVKAAEDICDLPVFVSMSYNVVKSGFRTMMGVSPNQAVEGLLEAGADVVGANCGDVLAAMMPELIRQMKEAGAKLVVIEPNAGVPQIVNGKTAFPQKPQEMAESIPAIVDAGANVIGACCGSTPKHISLIVQAIRKYLRRR